LVLKINKESFYALNQKFKAFYKTFCLDTKSYKNILPKNKTVLDTFGTKSIVKNYFLFL